MAPLPNTPYAAADEAARQRRWPEEHVIVRTAHGITAIDTLDAAIAPTNEVVAMAAAALAEGSRLLRDRTIAFEDLDRRCGDAVRVGTDAARVLAVEYDRILAMDDVASVEMTPDAMVVVTRDLHIVEDGIRYNIGPYRVTIPRSGGTSAIRAETLRTDRKYAASGYPGMQHPHVFKNGTFCWGNAEEQLRRCFAESEYDLAVALVIGVLKSGRPPGHESASSSYSQVLRSIGTPEGAEEGGMR